MSPRRIGFVTTMTGNPWGGSEELWSQAAHQLAAMGHHVTALVAHYPTLHPKLAALAANGVQVSSLPAPARRRWWARKIGSAPLLRRFGTDLPELLVISSGGLYEGREWMAEAAAAGVPFVVIIQAVVDFWRPGHWREYAADYAKAAAVYFVAEDNRRTAERLLVTRPQRSKVVRNPFQASYDGILPWPEETDGTLQLACVARLEFPAKGHDILIETLAQPHWQARNIRVNCYGEGWDRQYFEELAAHYGAERVRFLGQIADVTEMWRSHHALILPSRYEGTPLAMVEAMLCGRPCIVTDIAGNAEVTEDGINGFVAAAPTVRHLDAALERAWARRADWQAMGNLAAARVRSLFPASPAKAMADELLTVIA